MEHSSLCLNYVAVFSCAVFLTWVPLLAEKLFLALENNQTAFDSLSSFAESLHCNGPTLRSHIDRLFFRTRFFFLHGHYVLNVNTIKICVNFKLKYNYQTYSMYTFP